MLDGFARSITYLRISITDRCNYRCRYCMPDGGIEKCAHEDICSLEGLRDMAAAAVRCGVKKIRVTGGEPLVRRGAVDFCRMLSEIPGVEELCVTTNGSLLKEVARPLRDAGVTHLNISLDTLNEERFRAITRLGTLQDTLDGIEAAERAGFAKIKLNCVLLGGVHIGQVFLDADQLDHTGEDLHGHCQVVAVGEGGGNADVAVVGGFAAGALH